MWQLLTIVNILSIIIGNCDCRKEYDRTIIDERARYGYDDIDRNYRQQTELVREPSQIQYYKTARRAERVPSYQYTSEDNSPVEEYSYQSKRYQKIPQPTENYPYQRDIEQIIRNSQYNRVAKKPIVEQYLKEVTPTTKTIYNQRPTYQPHQISSTFKQQDQIDETTRNLHQIPIQYVLQTDLQQHQKQANVEPTPQYEAIEEQVPVKQLTKQIPTRNFNIVAYQNALLAHQKLLESDNNNNDGTPSRSTIYVQQNIPKTVPVRGKTQQIQAVPSTRQPQTIVLPEPSEYYRQKMQVYDAPVRYQARIPYQKDETNEYREQNDEQDEKRPVQYFQVKQSRFVGKTRQPPTTKYRPEANDFQADHVYDYQPVPVAVKQQQQVQTRPVRVQYTPQHPAQVSTRQPEKYLPETYEQNDEEVEYQHVRKIPTTEQLSAVIYQRGRTAKYQSEKDVEPTIPYQIQYTKERQDFHKLQQPVRYRTTERRRNDAPQKQQNPKYYYRNRYALYDEN